MVVVAGRTAALTPQVATNAPQTCCRPYAQGMFDDYSLHHTTIVSAGTNPCVAEYHAGMVGRPAAHTPGLVQVCAAVSLSPALARFASSAPPASHVGNTCQRGS